MHTELAKRIGTGLVLAIAVVALIYFGGWPLKVVVSLLVFACSYEYLRMVPAPIIREGKSLAFSSEEAMWYSLLSMLPVLSYCVYGERYLLLGVFLFFAFLLLSQLLKLGARSTLALNQTGGLFTALLSNAVYPVLPASLMAIALIEIPKMTSLLLLLIVAANDTAAYFGGSRLGGAKLLARISPGKTWSGFACGLLAASLCSLLAGVFDFPFFSSASYLQIFAFGSLFGLLAVLGDLFESLVKRSFGCKDSGSILPGHGGILDRVDAHLFAFPFLLALFKLI